ncbi:MAG: hypothetical protein GX845_05220 [Erysipelothrix sp.]|nr:hypothetical protein [Erysipelothrix sp.]
MTYSHETPCFEMPREARGLIEASLLTLLNAAPSYGYKLLDNLSNFGFDHESIDISGIYRNLRSMEGKQLIASQWATSDQGPSKRMYEITALGQNKLKHWVTHLKNRRQQMALIIQSYETQTKENQ